MPPKRSKPDSSPAKQPHQTRQSAQNQSNSNLPHADPIPFSFAFPSPPLNPTTTPSLLTTHHGITQPITLKTPQDRQSFIAYIFKATHASLTADDLSDFSFPRWSPTGGIINHNALIRHFRSSYSTKAFETLTADTSEHRAISNFVASNPVPITDLSKTTLTPSSTITALTALEFIHFLMRIRAPTDPNTAQATAQLLANEPQQHGVLNSSHFLSAFIARHDFHRSQFPKLKPVTWTTATQKKIGQILARAYIVYADPSPLTHWLWALVALAQSSASEQLTTYTQTPTTLTTHSPVPPPTLTLPPTVSSSHAQTVQHTNSTPPTHQQETLKETRDRLLKAQQQTQEQISELRSVQKTCNIYSSPTPIYRS